MVGLVDHADLHVAQVAVPLLDEVGQPPRAGDDDVHPVAERCNLRVLPDAAEYGRHRQVHRRGQRRDHGVHLGGQLPGGDQDEAAGVAGEGVPVRQACDQRDREPERLAGTGPPAAQDVQAGQRIGQGGGLDRERREDARPGQDVDQRRGHAEVGEGHAERGDLGGLRGAGLAGTGLASRGLTAAAPPPAGTRLVNRQSCHTGKVSKTRVAAFEGRHVRGNQLAHRATYDRRALMAAPHDLPCCLILSHTSHPTRLPSASAPFRSATAPLRRAVTHRRING